MNTLGRTLAVVALAGALGVLCVGTAAAAQKAAQKKEQPSLYDRARAATIRGAKATDAALTRAAHKTEDFLKARKVPQKVDAAAAKTDAALDRAANKVGLPATAANGTAAPAKPPSPKSPPDAAKSPPNTGF